MNDLNEHAGLLARRLAVAIGGALGVAATQLEQPLHQAITGAVSVALVAGAEYFSQRHNRKLRDGRG